MKVLVSTGHGAGWSSWAHHSEREIATYQPIIDYLEQGGDAKALEGIKKYEPAPLNLSNEEAEAWMRARQHPLVQKMMDDLGLSYFFAGGGSGLTVQDIPAGPFRVTEYDGHESVEFPSQEWW